MASSAQSRQRISALQRGLQLLRAWRRHHSQSAADALGRVLAQPIASVLSWLVIGVAIALPAGLWLVLDNLSLVAGQMQGPAQLSVFLDDSLSSDAARSLTMELNAREEIDTAQFIDRDDALQEFEEQAGMGDLLARLPENPLPHVILLMPHSDDPALLAPLRDELLAREEVDEVVLDTLWLQRLQAIMQLGRRAVQVLAVLSLAAVVLVLGNTIRLAIENRRDEIVIIKLVGGTDAFVRRPLLYTGLWYGLGGGFMASILVFLALIILSVPVAGLAAAYQSSFALRGPGLVDSLQLILLGGLLGLAGAWLAVARHLSDIEPR